MKTIALELEDSVASQFAQACRSEGHGEDEVATGLFRRYLDVERLRRNLAEKRLGKLYEALVTEDVALAESGMADYQRGLAQADQP
jgi:hypothetical protein